MLSRATVRVSVFSFQLVQKGQATVKGNTAGVALVQVEEESRSELYDVELQVTGATLELLREVTTPFSVRCCLQTPASFSENQIMVARKKMKNFFLLLLFFGLIYLTRFFRLYVFLIIFVLLHCKQIHQFLSHG